MEAGVTDSEEEVLVVMDLADLSHVSEGGASVQASEGRVDLRTEVFLVGETSVASAIVVSAGAISAIAGLAVLVGTFSVLALMALDSHIIHTTPTRIIIHTTVTRITIRIRTRATVPI
jgi:hypothetical protein